MAENTIQVKAVIDGKLFVSFAFYDTFVHKKKWRLPLCFLLLMSVFAAGCFLLQEREAQAWLLGTVLLLVGIGLPLCYVLSFLLSVLAQSRRLNLKQSKAAYVLTLTGEKLSVANEKGERAEYPLSELHAAVRRKNCTYFYVTAQKAYLMPHARIKGGGQTLWELLGSPEAQKKRW